MPRRKTTNPYRWSIRMEDGTKSPYEIYEDPTGPDRARVVLDPGTTPIVYHMRRTGRFDWECERVDEYDYEAGFARDWSDVDTPRDTTEWARRREVVAHWRLYDPLKRDKTTLGALMVAFEGLFRPKETPDEKEFYRFQAADIIRQEHDKRRVKKARQGFAGVGINYEV